MYGSGEGVLLPASLVGAIRVGNVHVKVVGGWFGGGWGVPGLQHGRGVTLLV